jgi:hypothetical protein
MGYADLVHAKFNKFRNKQEWLIRYFIIALNCDFRVLDAFTGTGFFKVPIAVGKYITYEKDDKYTTLEALNDGNEKRRSYMVPFNIVDFPKGGGIYFANTCDGNLWIQDKKRNLITVQEFVIQQMNLPLNTQFTFIWINYKAANQHIMIKCHAQLI